MSVTQWAELCLGGGVTRNLRGLSPTYPQAHAWLRPWREMDEKGCNVCLDDNDESAHLIDHEPYGVGLCFVGRLRS